MYLFFHEVCLSASVWLLISVTPIASFRVFYNVGSAFGSF